jgi:hypothetical protein
MSKITKDSKVIVPATGMTGRVLLFTSRQTACLRMSDGTLAAVPVGELRLTGG